MGEQRERMKGRVARGTEAHPELALDGKIGRQRGVNETPARDSGLRKGGLHQKMTPEGKEKRRSRARRGKGIEKRGLTSLLVNGVGDPLPPSDLIFGPESGSVRPLGTCNKRSGRRRARTLSTTTTLRNSCDLPSADVGTRSPLGSMSVPSVMMIPKPPRARMR